MERGRAPDVSGWAGKAGEGRLEGHLQELCDDKNSNPSSQPCTKIFSSSEPPQQKKSPTTHCTLSDVIINLKPFSF
jgi:hypothetical protein